MTAGSPLTLDVPSDLAVMPMVRQFIESASRLANLDQESIDAIVLAVNEATTNVIRHAHQCRTEIQVHLECKLLIDGIVVTVIDQGDPFDITAVPDLDPAEERVGGRGVFLMRTLLDELVCVPLESGGNQLRMVRRRRRK
jgi:serine/threonine-protein kinase RsbW